LSTACCIFRVAVLGFTAALLNVAADGFAVDAWMKQLN
jgi:hypothetical protein